MRFLHTASPPAAASGRTDGLVKALLFGALLVAAPAPVADEAAGRGEELMAAGREALRQGDAAAAATAFAEAARLTPTDSEIFFQLGSARESLGEKEPAVAAFRRAIDIEPGHVPARRALVRLGGVGWSAPELKERAELLALDGRLKEAVYLFERYLKDEPEDARAVLGLARCRERLGEADAALQLYRRARDLDPGLDEARSRLAAEAPAAAPRVEPAAPPEAARVTTPPPSSPAEVRPTASGQAEPAAPPARVADPEAPAGAEVPPSSKEAGGEARTEPARTEPARTEPARPEPAGTEPARSPEPQAPAAPAREAESPAEAGAEKSSSWPLPAALAVAVPATAFLFVILLRRRRSYSIRGQLERFPLPDALQLLGAGGKEGVLEVAAGGGGWIWLESGRIVAAESGGDTGSKALFAVLSAGAGTFAFYERALPEGLETSLDLSVQEALLQWAESVDDGNRDASPEAGTGGELSLDEIEDEILNAELPF